MRQKIWHERFCRIAIGASLFCLGLHGCADTTTGQVAKVQIALSDCRLESFGGYTKVKAQCGVLRVPMDPTKPASKYIDLSIAKISALTRKPQASAFTLIAGGPGQSSQQAYATQAGAFERILRERDILLVDQRGTGRSNQQQCDSYNDPMFQSIEQWTPELTRKSALMCLQDLGEDVAYYTTSLAVKDLESVRVAMGYEQLDLYGVSYGTRVAQHYLRRFPERTRSVILDGVIPVTLALGPEIAIDAQNALESIFARCTSDQNCSEHFGDIKQKFFDLKTILEDTPIQVNMPDPISAEMDTHQFGINELGLAIRLMSYSPDMISLMPLMIHQASQGNYQPLAAQAIKNTALLSDMLAYGMHNSVVCAEDAPFFDKTFDAEQLQTTYLGDWSYQGLVEMCKIWPRGPIDDDFKQIFDTPTPVLLLSGEVDPITPPANADVAATYLNNSLSVVVNGQGHNVGSIGCVPRLMAEFVAAASHDNLDISCTQVQQASPFFQNFSGSAP